MEDNGTLDPEQRSLYEPEPGTLESGAWFWLENGAVALIGKELGAHALAIYCVLARRANSVTRQCWPSYATIAADAGCSKATVERCVPMLAAHGFVRVEQRFIEKVRTTRRRGRNGVVEKVTERRRENATNLYTLIDRVSVEVTAVSGHPHRGERPPHPPGAVIPAAESGDPRRREQPPQPLTAATVAALSGANETNGNRPIEQDEHNKAKTTRRSGRDDGTTPPAASAAVGRGAKEPRRERREAMAAAFFEAQGEDAADYPLRTLYEVGRALAGLPEKFTPADVHDCTLYLLTFPHFKEPGALSAAKVAATVPRWVNEGRPEWRDCDGVPDDIVARWDYDQWTKQLTELEAKRGTESLTAEEERERQSIIQSLAALRARGYDFGEGNGNAGEEREPERRVVSVWPPSELGALGGHGT